MAPVATPSRLTGHCAVMDAEKKTAVDVAEGELARLCERARSEDMRTKLRFLDEACRRIVLKHGRRLTVPEAVDAFRDAAGGSGLTLAEQSLRNRRGGQNPLNELYRAWGAVSAALIGGARPKRATRIPGDGIIGQDELERIADTSTRAKVRLIVAENRNLRSERAILKAARDAPVVRVVTSMDPDVLDVPAGPAPLELDEAELDSIRNFVDPAAMAARRLRRADDGAIEIQGKAITDPAFADAIDKILRSQAG